MTIDSSHVMNVILAGLALATIMGIIGALLWYIKVKPDVENLRTEVAKKAAIAEVARVALELETRRLEQDRIQMALDQKQEIENCELLRKSCQPLVSMQIENLCKQIDGLNKKLDSWMDWQQYGKR